MLMYKSGRFYAGNSSFALPDGSRIDSTPDVQPEVGIVVYPPDRDDYYIDIDYHVDEEDAQEGLNGVLMDISIDKSIRATPANFSKASGWEAFYNVKRNSMYEVRFDVNQQIEDDDIETVLVIFITAEKERRYEIVTLLSNF